MTRADEIMLVAQVADNDSMMSPLGKLKSINGGAGSLVLNFDATANVAAVTLTTGADEFAALKALCRALNGRGRNMQSNVVVLADAAAATATVTVVPEITGCSTIA
jgi:hypothetical protein